MLQSGFVCVCFMNICTLNWICVHVDYDLIISDIKDACLYWRHFTYIKDYHSKETLQINFEYLFFVLQLVT